MNNYYFISTEEFKIAVRKIYYSTNYTYSNNEFQKLLVQKVKLLKIFPQMYTIFNKKEQLRKIPIQKYLIIYRIENKTIHFVNLIPIKSNRYNHLYYT